MNTVRPPPLTVSLTVKFPFFLRLPLQHAIISHVGEGEGVCGVVVSVGGYVVLGNLVTINVTKCIIKLVTNFITEYIDSLKLQI